MKILTFQNGLQGNALKNMKYTRKQIENITRVDLAQEDMEVYNYIMQMPFHIPDDMVSEDISVLQVHCVIAFYRVLQKSFRVKLKGIYYLQYLSGIYDERMYPIYPTIIPEMDEPQNAEKLQNIRIYTLYAYALMAKKVELAAYIHQVHEIDIDPKRLKTSIFKTC
jgi:hypothetical protein